MEREKLLKHRISMFLTVAQLAYIFEGDSSQSAVTKISNRYLRERLKKGSIVPPTLTIVRPFSVVDNGGPIMILADEKLADQLAMLSKTNLFLDMGFEFCEK